MADTAFAENEAKSPEPGALAPPGRIEGGFAVDPTRRLAALAGHATFAATERGDDRAALVAMQVAPGAPPRAQALSLLAVTSLERVMGPLGQGAAPDAAGQPAWFVVCRVPPGPALWPANAPAPRPWSDAELLDCLLRPVAAALETLQARHVTHRAIRPDNLFRPAQGEPVTLGPAWAAPPASFQPVLFEPPYAALCHKAGRGEGSIADDVYALGVTMIVLATGRLPMAGLSEAEIIRRKVDLGSYAALTAETRLSPAIADLVRGMLAEDPDHRPTPALLSDPDAARARRVASRPPHRAQRALEHGDMVIWTARMLALALAGDPEEAARLLRTGVVDRWLRRSLGDSALAARIEEACRQRNSEAEADNPRADGVLVARAVALLDPLAPLCWRGVALWPDGLGALLADAAGDAQRLAVLRDLVESEAIGVWAAARPERCDVMVLRADAQHHHSLLRLRGWAGGLSRLTYALNPLLACRSPRLGAGMVVRLADLLPALEAVAAPHAAATPPLPAPLDAPPIDPEIAAFLAARLEQRIERDLALIADPADRDRAARAQLRLLAWLQRRTRAPALPALAAWLAAHLRPGLANWRGRKRREMLEKTTGELVRTGQLPALLALLDDPQARAQDQADAQAADEAVRAIDAELQRILEARSARAALARRVGREIALSAALVALAIAAVAAAMA